MADFEEHLVDLWIILFIRGHWGYLGDLGRPQQIFRGLRRTLGDLKDLRDIWRTFDGPLVTFVVFLRALGDFWDLSKHLGGSRGTWGTHKGLLRTFGGPLVTFVVLMGKSWETWEDLSKHMGDQYWWFHVKNLSHAKVTFLNSNARVTTVMKL